jgi:thymidylate kinase
MLIVLEGCDGTGKTTLAQSLQQVIPDCEILHFTSRTPNTFEYFKSVVEASKKRNIIADRFCYGQFVYQDPKDRWMTESELRNLEVLMVEAGARVIHVCASSLEVSKRLSCRHEATKIPVDVIMDRFQDVFGESLITPIVWWTGHEG